MPLQRYPCDPATKCYTFAFFWRKKGRVCVWSEASIGIMLGTAASGPLQRPLLLASSGVDVGASSVHVGPVQGGTTGTDTVTPRDVCTTPGRSLDEDDGCGRLGSTTSSVRQLNPVKRSACCRRFGEWVETYAEALETNPIRTKCVSSAVLGGVADIIAQGSLRARGSDALWCDTNVRGTPAVERQP